MATEVLQDVFSLDELARAARVPRAALQRLIASGDLRPIRGTRFFSGADAVRAGRLVQTLAPAFVPGDPVDLFATTAAVSSRRSIPIAASTAAHLLLVGIVAWLAARPSAPAPLDERREPARLVFVISPGPGGGGGGGGARNPLPAAAVERKGDARQRVTVPRVHREPVMTTARRVEEPPKPTPVAPPVPQPTPVEKPPDPLPSRTLVAPVVQAAANDRDREGVIEQPAARESQGRGAGGGAGSGQGTGNGQGLGTGIGDGSGGGTGGGPYRPGSGIDPPRLLREVKAEYTEEARRRNITGDVVLEIVVTRDGGVGDVRVLQGLGGGLDQRAIAAVRQWRFSPAHRRGEAVDVIVEVAVEFTLR